MKRVLSVAILAAMLLGIAGCSSGGQTESNPSSKTPDGDGKGEVVTLDVFSMPSNTSGLWEGWAAEIIKEKIGVEVNLLPSGDQGEQKLQALMASGELPDVVVFKENTQVINAVAGDMLLAYDDNKDLVPHVYENAEASLRYYADHVSDGKGKAYSVGSRIMKEIPSKGALNWGPVMRYDLYKELGSPEIKTYEDYLPVLKKMQDLNPTNADGQKVYAFSLWSDWDDALMSQATNLACINGVNTDVQLVEIDHQNNNKVTSMLDEDSWYFKNLKFYYEANQMGLLDPDSMTQRFDDALSKASSGRILFTWWAWATGTFDSQENRNNGIGFMQVEANDTKVLHQGIKYTGQPWSWSVSAASKHPEKAFALVDAMYDPDIMMEMVNGPKGVTWDVDENNTPYVLEDGYPYLLDTTKEFPGGNNLAKGSTAVIFNANGLDNTFVMKDYNGVQMGNEFWDKPDYAPADTKLVDMWQEDYGAEDQIDYLNQRDAIVVAPAVNYPVMTDDMQQILARVGDIVQPLSWKMVFAKDEAEYEALKAEMIEKAKGVGIDEYVDWFKEAYADALELASEYTE